MYRPKFSNCARLFSILTRFHAMGQLFSASATNGLAKGLPLHLHRTHSHGLTVLAQLIQRRPEASGKRGCGAGAVVV